MNILHIDSSALGSHSVSRELTDAIATQLRRNDAAATVRYRDLDVAPPAHLSGQLLAAGQAADPQALPPEIRAQQALGKAMLDEFLAADVVIVGAPMYNFSVPSSLKAWIDRISVAGVTFRYTAEGPVGLIRDKTVIIASSRGGRHGESAMDHQEAYLRTVFSFFGIRDVRIVRAEGLNMGAAIRDAALLAARADIAALAA